MQHMYLATNVQVVKLPKGEDFNDWLAVHVVDFFNRCILCFCWQILGGMKEELWSVSLALICTGSTWSMALCVSSAVKRAVPPCQEELNLSTFGRWDFCTIFPSLISDQSHLSCQVTFVLPASIKYSHVHIMILGQTVCPSLIFEGWSKVQKAGPPSCATIHCPPHGLGEP